MGPMGGITWRGGAHGAIVGHGSIPRRSAQSSLRGVPRVTRWRVGNETITVPGANAAGHWDGQRAGLNHGGRQRGHGGAGVDEPRRGPAGRPARGTAGRAQRGGSRVTSGGRGRAMRCSLHGEGPGAAAGVSASGTA